MITGDAFRVKVRESFVRAFTAFPGHYFQPVNSRSVAPTHPVAPYPSNAVEVPQHFYSPAQPPGLGHAGPPNIERTTTALLPPVGTSIDGPTPLGTDLNLQRGIPPTRVPRLYPNREPAGVRFAAMTNSMGIPNGDMYFVPLPAIPRFTATPRSVRSGYPQLADDKYIPGIYVGGDA